jgi:pimeloyl-ACP methyl ester carboxylesterase
MSLAVEVLLLLVCCAVSACIIFAVVFVARPIATTFWFRRRSLLRSGFRKTKVATTVGLQTVFHGGEGPVVVLLHGAGDQAGTWHRIAPDLKRQFQLVMPDLAGHGESDPAEGTLSLGTLLIGLEQALEDIPGRYAPITLVGNSLGAWMAMLFAEKYPQRVTRVILMGGGPIRGASELGLMPKNREEARRAFEATLDPSARRPPNFLLDDLIRVANTGPISRLFAAGDADMSKYLLEGKLSNFQLPVDLVWGASDRLVPLDYAKKLQAQLPHATLTVLERCGHVPQIERPRHLLATLLPLLAANSSHAPAQSVSPQPGGNS